MSEEYKIISPFKWQLLESFPFIAEDFDQLTEYALYCKLVEYMNKVIDGTNTLGANVEEYITKFNALKDYVDDYFENLDVQDEIDNKLNEMAEDGTLEEILNGQLKVYNNNLLYGNDKDATLHIFSKTSSNNHVMPATIPGIIDYNGFDNVGECYVYDDRDHTTSHKTIVDSYTNNSFTCNNETFTSDTIKPGMYVLFYATESFENPTYIAKITGVSTTDEHTINVENFVDYSTKEAGTPSGIYDCWINPVTKFYDHYDYLYMTDDNINHGLHQADIYNYSDNGTLYHGFSPVMRHGHGGIAFRARAEGEHADWTTAFGTDGTGKFSYVLVNKNVPLIDGDNNYRQPFQYVTDTNSTIKSPVKKLYADTTLSDLGYTNGSVVKLINARSIYITLTGAFDQTGNITKYVMQPQEALLIVLYDDIFHIVSPSQINSAKQIPTYTANSVKYGFVPITQDTDLNSLNIPVGTYILASIDTGLTITSPAGNGGAMNTHSYGKAIRTFTTTAWDLGIIYHTHAGTYYLSF